MIISKRYILGAALFCSVIAAAYQPAGDRIMTTWGENINPRQVWQQYPRPIMERGQWESLNGLWNYAITDAAAPAPREYQGEILVPFCAESALSGVGKEVGKDNALWYTRNFSIPSDWKGKEIMLNFEAVDWECKVWVNDIFVGSHTGGYAPFSLDISPALKSKGENTITVRVWDPTDMGPQPRGKQVSNPNGIWYTPVTGIWQSVWLEPVPKTHISSLRISPDIDANTLSVDVEVAKRSDDDIILVVNAIDNNNLVATGKSIAGMPVVMNMPDSVKLWSPDSPNLYDLDISIYSNGKKLDSVKSYAAMRKFSTGRDKDGIVRLRLNNKDLFQFGTLDQGWWPDGLYTAPSTEALYFDIDKTKDLGFNMIRKHIKVEPRLWYTHCDRVGMIVWQDMPSGDLVGPWQNRQYYDGTEFKRSEFSEQTYRKEWEEIIDALYNYPCIAMWIPFNEGWGQFKTVEIADWTKKKDPSRLVNSASGGNHFHCGDILDLHNYPAPDMYMYDAQRATVLGEFGGMALPIEGHLWAPDRNWGYIQFKSPDELTDTYVDYTGRLKNLVSRGFSAGVYTQPTDVEIEVNGLMTYDRKVMKVNEDRVRQANKSLVESLSTK